FFFSSRRRHTRFSRDWSSDVCSSDLSGKSVGIFHWPLYESDVAKPLPDGLWRAALEDGVAIVTPGEHLTARTVVCRTPTALEDRSEERRVGKEWRSRWSAMHVKKNNK